MFKRFQNYIENSTWDELSAQDGRLLNRICWTIAISAAVYFGCMMLRVMIQGPIK